MIESALSMLIAVLVLGLMIFVHELGHFIVAKLVGVGVLEFSIGFGRQLWRKRKGETHYALRLIPLGGYVRMFGDDPFEAYGQKSSVAKPQTSLSEKEEGQQPSEEKEEGLATPENWGLELDELDRQNMADQSRWFLKKGFWRRAAIVVAGPVANLVMAYFISFATFIAYGRPFIAEDQDIPPIIGGVAQGQPAEKAGLKALDRVLAIDDRQIGTWNELQSTIRNSGGRELKLLIERGNEVSRKERLEVHVTPEPDSGELKLLDEKAGAGISGPLYRIGMSAWLPRVPVGFLESFKYAGLHIFGICRFTFKVFKALLTGVVQPSKVVSGPIGILREAATSVQVGAERLFDLMVLLSVGLAILNLLPIPVLDGGHLLFFIIEALKGSPVNLKWQAVASQVGMAILATLMIFAISNDILHLF